MENKLIRMSILLLCIFSFLGYIIKKDVFLVCSSLAFLLIYFFGKKDFRISKKNIIWIICFMITCISILFSINPKSTIYYIAFLGVLLACKIILEKNEKWLNFFINIVIILGIIQVCFCILSLININLIRKINEFFMSYDELSNFNMWTRLGARIGINSDASLMAFFASITIGASFSIIMSGDKRIRWKIIFVLSILALIITTKRGPLLATVIAIIVLVLLAGSGTKKIQNFLKLILITVIILLIFQETSLMNKIFSRFSNMTGNNILSGRVELYEKQFERIEENIFVGNGAFTTDNFLDGTDGHNIYIQLLLEYGIIGFICYIILFVYNFYYTIKCFKNCKKIGSYNYLIFFSIFVQVFFLTYGMSGNPLYNFYILNIYIISTAIPIIIERERKINENRDSYIS